MYKLAHIKAGRPAGNIGATTNSNADRLVDYHPLFGLILSATILLRNVMFWPIVY